MPRPLATLGLIAILLPFSASAQQGESHVPPSAHPPVSLTELDGLARQAFSSRDLNRDDDISMTELRADRGSFGGGGKNWALDVLGAVHWLRSDRNGDGKVSSYEVAERYRARFEDLDRDGDQALTHAEWRASQVEELRHACITAPDCKQVEELERRRQRMVERNGRAFERLDWTVRSHYRHNSGLTAPLYTAVRDYRSWHSLWDRMASRMGPKRVSPAIDFSRDMVLVAAMGSRPSGGHSIQIVSVRDLGRELLATVVRTSPGKKCGATAAITQPADIVKVAASEKPVRWDMQDRAPDC